MKAVDVIEYINKRMSQLKTHCVIALIIDLTTDEEYVYIFTSDCTRKYINAFWKDTGIADLGLSSSHADYNDNEYCLIKVTDISDTIIV